MQEGEPVFFSLALLMLSNGRGKEQLGAMGIAGIEVICCCDAIAILALVSSSSLIVCDLLTFLTAVFG